MPTLAASDTLRSCRQDRGFGSGTASSPLGQTGQQRQAVPQYTQQLGGMPAQTPMYYVPTPQMYYPPSAYAYPGGMVMNAPSKEQIEEAVQKQVASRLDWISLGIFPLQVAWHKQRQSPMLEYLCF